MESPGGLRDRVALVTGGAQRIGAAIAEALHGAGANLIIHYRHSRRQAQALQSRFNEQRPDSVVLVQADLLATAKLSTLIRETVSAWGRLDILVNNASSFYPTAVGKVEESAWEDLLGTNLKAPFFLCQAAAPHLGRQRGCIVNIADIHAERPLRGYPVYSIAKGAMGMLTKALACELGPSVRVNAVAPGSILWPEGETAPDEVTKQRIVSRTFLKRQGSPVDIAKAVLYLVRDADYVTGQILAVDGGRSLNA